MSPTSGAAGTGRSGSSPTAPSSPRPGPAASPVQCVQDPRSKVKDLGYVKSVEYLGCDGLHQLLMVNVVQAPLLHNLQLGLAASISL